MDNTQPEQGEATTQQEQVSQTPSTPAPERKQYGPLIGIVIIVALLALGGLYFWGMKLLQQDEVSQENQNDPVLESLQSQSSSDEIEDIEADLEATSIDNLDSGAAEAEAELQVQ